jgi:hypothetical protein
MGKMTSTKSYAPNNKQIPNFQIRSSKPSRGGDFVIGDWDFFTELNL